MCVINKREWPASISRKVSHEWVKSVPADETFKTFDFTTAVNDKVWCDKSICFFPLGKKYQVKTPNRSTNILKLKVRFNSKIHF